ncbi:hypothetical protein AAVH_22183 [Aphelenchoides avenae]|nr:hypothetical protein AAVH_22183 [Aphelenchus avenae]
MTVGVAPHYTSCQPSSSSDSLCGLSASPRIRKVLSKKAKKAEKKNEDEKEAPRFAKQIRSVLKQRILNRLKKMFSLSDSKLDKDQPQHPPYRKLNRSRSVQSRRSSCLSAYDPMPTIAEETESQLIDATASRKSTACQLPIASTEYFIAELKFVSSIDVVV